MNSQFYVYWTITSLSLLLSPLQVCAEIEEVDNEVAVYETLEKALLNKNKLYWLQSIFYPSHTVQNSYVEFNVTFKVRNISNCTDDAYPEKAFDCNSYKRTNDNDYDAYSDVVSVLSTDVNDQYLEYYVQQNFFMLKSIDITFFSLLNIFVTRTTANTASPYRSDIPSMQPIELIIEYLPNNPAERDLINALEQLFTWVKYYARTSNKSKFSPRLDSDRSFATHSYLNYNNNKELSKNGFSYTLKTVTIFSFIVFVHISVLLCGSFMVKISTSNTIIFDSLLSPHMKVILFWSVFAVLFVVNTSVFIAELYIFFAGQQIHLRHIYVYFDAPLMLNLPIICIFSFLEICVISSIGKNIIVSSHIFCISRPFIVRAVHCYALCNMLWFAHRVANCFIVSICFMAISPSQTIAVSTLLLSAIVTVIAALTSVLHIFYSETSRKCLKVCNTLAVLLTVLSILATSVFFTIIFVDLTNHGLSATHIGSIILSMVIPTLIFVMSFMLKKYFKRSQESINGESNLDKVSEYQPLQGDKAA